MPKKPDKPKARIRDKLVWPNVAAPAKKRPRGRPTWEPTAEQRMMVKVCMGTGFTQEQVAAILRVDHDTLVKHCRHELDTGHLEIDAKIGGKLVQQCLSGNVTALIFWHKTRRGWRETSDVNHSGSIGVRHEDALRELD